MDEIRIGFLFLIIFGPWILSPLFLVWIGFLAYDAKARREKLEAELKRSDEEQKSKEQRSDGET